MRMCVQLASPLTVFLGAHSYLFFVFVLFCCFFWFSIVIVVACYRAILRVTVTKGLNYT